MSLILEALKKSEAERRLGETPHLGSVTTWTPARRTSAWWWAALPLVLVVAAAGWSNRDLLTGKPMASDEDLDVATAASAKPGQASAPVDVEAVVDPTLKSGVELTQKQNAESARSGPPAAFARKDGPQPGSAQPLPLPDPVAMPQTIDDLDAMKDVSPENQRRIESGEVFVPNPALLAERGPTTETQIVTAEAALPPPLEEPAVIEPAPIPDKALSRDDQFAREQAQLADRMRNSSNPMPAVAPPPAPTSPPPADSVANPAPVATASSVMSIHDLTLGQRQGLPPLKMSVHFYNRDVARRFVIVDGQRLEENGVAGNELWARDITPEGVVMEYRNVRFLLPRIGG